MEELEMYWNSVPVGRNNALSYDELCEKWNVDQRKARRILHCLSTFDNGDDYVLIRMSNGTGFFRSQNLATIEAYRREVLARGKNVMSCLSKCNRILRRDEIQFNMENRIRMVRRSLRMTQSRLCELLTAYDVQISTATLADIEEGTVQPSRRLLNAIAEILGCAPADLFTCKEYDGTDEETPLPLANSWGRGV